MAILSDGTLHRIPDLVTPFNPTHIQPCSIDLTIGNTIKIESVDQNNNGFVEVDINQPYELRPGQFCLASTTETVRLPDHIAAQVMLRSSAARMGFDHHLAGFIDCGFYGQICLELKNNLQLNNLKIQAGMRLIQIVFYELDCSAEKGYGVTGNYQGQTGVTESNRNLLPLAA